MGKVGVLFFGVLLIIGFVFVARNRIAERRGQPPQVGDQRLPPGKRASPLPTSAPSLPAGKADMYGVSFGGENISDRRVPKALELADQAGIPWVRISIGWSLVEPENDKWNWRETDALMDKVSSLGLNIAPQILPSSRWVSSAPSCSSDSTIPNCETRREFFPPSDYGEFDEFVHTLVSRYGSRGRNQIHHWEIWNEPDLAGYWPKGGSSEYARLLDVANDAAKRADPDAQVVFGGLALGGTPGTSDENLFTSVLDNREHPGAENFDIANFHHYGPQEEAKKRMDYITGEMQKRGIAKPVWVTEVGIAAANESEEDKQVEYMREIVPYLVSLGAQRIFWFDLLDDPPGSTDGFRSYGILKNDTVSQTLVPKKAYATYKGLISSGTSAQ